VLESGLETECSTFCRSVSIQKIMAGKKQAGRPSQKGQGKNKQRSVPVVDIPGEEVAVSDEDVEFFSRGKGHAFLAKLDASKLEEVKKVRLNSFQSQKVSLDIPSMACHVV
jgi:hypothetical protein